ncbi:hypothetical protein QBC34DRAFT_440496 [Podospora aff. communis PSN243]|uniref:Uncharacterized protein n=1 Tax=Podospora aff. communis PSN243 TaxID=3040156 RepID=A0AAV9GFK4_9PEZI|nr:hypothetical protein QBC34DRAFT_440496 [Podospora aff. communis PSN243]
MVGSKFSLGLVAAATLLALSVLCLAADLISGIYLRSHKGIKKKARMMRWLKAAVATIAVSLGAATLALGRAEEKTPGDCVDADADIVGDGVRVAAWVQICMITILATSGLFFQESASAIKELGGGLLITTTSLSIALLVPLTLRNLPPIDAILGALVLDGLGNAMAIQLNTKETLAARWQVCMCVAGQAVGLVAQGLLVHSFSSDLLSSDDSCRCFSAFWWVWSTNCAPDVPNVAFWLYYALRCVVFLFKATIAGIQMIDFDDAKKWDQQNPCVKCLTGPGNATSWVRYLF